MSVFAQLWTVPAEKIEDAADEAALIEAAKTGDEAAQLRLFAAYVPALRSAVKQFAPTLGLDDARQSAYLGFLDVIQQHDPERSERLAGRLTVRLADSLSEAASDASGGFTVPARTLRRWYSALREAEGDLVEAERIARTKGMPRETFLAVQTAVQADASLEYEADNWGDSCGAMPLDSVLTSREATDVDDALLVSMAFAAVNELETTVTRLAYGFAEYDVVPDAEIGHRLGFSRLKALRVRQGALIRMREAIGA